VLVVAERSDAITWKSLRNIGSVHLLEPGQLNTYDVLISDEVVFTQGALDTFVAGPVRGKSAKASATSSEVEEA
jgi:large subunit ribosomal protein L4